MLLIPIIIIALSAGVLVFMILNQTNKKQYNENMELGSTSDDFAQKKEAFAQLEQNIFSGIEKKYGGKYITDIKDGMIAVGMPSAFLLMAWGQPEEKSGLKVYNGSGEKWIYRQEAGRGKTNNTEVTILNKKVDSWKDI